MIAGTAHRFWKPATGSGIARLPAQHAHHGRRSSLSVHSSACWSHAHSHTHMILFRSSSGVTSREPSSAAWTARSATPGMGAP